MATSGRHSLAQNAVSIFVGQISTWLITAATFAVLPRYLGANDVGVFFIGGTFAALAGTVAGLGITTLLIREIARDRERGAALTGTAIWLTVGLGIIGGTIAVAAAFFLGYTRLTMFAVVISCVGLPFALVGGITNAVLQGVEVMRWAALLDVVTKFAGMLLVVAVVVFDLGIPGLLLGGLFMTVCTTVLQVTFARRFLAYSLRSFSLPTAWQLTKKSLPFLMASIFFTLYTSTDIVLLSRLADESAVGIYSTPMRLFGTMLFVPVTITTVIFPRLAASHGREGGGLNLGRITLKISVFASIALSLGAVSLSDDTLVGVLGSSFHGSGPVIVVLAASLVPTSISIVASRMIFAADRQAVVTALGAGAFVTKVVLGFLLIPLFDARWGNPALGAATGLVLIELGMVAGMLMALPKGLFDAESRRFYLRLAASAGAAVAVAALAYTRLPLAAGAAGVTSYALFAVLFGAARLSVVREGIRVLISGLQLRSVQAAP